MPAIRLTCRPIALCAALGLGAIGCGRHAPASHPPPPTARPPARLPTRGHNVVINMPWKLLSARGATIRLQWVGGGCLTFDRTQAVETPRQVTITLFAYQHLPGAGEACAADAFLAVATVHLHQPIGARRIVHAPPTP